MCLLIINITVYFEHNMLLTDTQYRVSLLWNMVCSINEFIKKRHWLLINVVCLIFFFLQFGGVLDGYIDPVNTHTVVGTQDLQNIAIPIIFKICVPMAFNQTFLEESFYDGIVG